MKTRTSNLVSKPIKILVFDFGASNGRASLGYYNGNIIKIDTIHRFENNPVFVTGTLYWDILRLFHELKKGLVAAFQKNRNIESMGIDTWGVDFGLIDKSGKLIANPVHYRDRKRNEILNEAFKIIPKKELFYLSGCSIVSYYSIFNLYALQKYNASEYDKANKFLMIPDLFQYFLTGETFNEYTNAHTTIMCNPFKKEWEKTIIQRFHFNSDIFCNIIHPGSVVGKLQSSISQELGINPIQVIAPATHDTASAFAAIPKIEHTKKAAYISLGTWGIIIKESDGPIINEQIYLSGFANEAAAEDKMMIFKNFAGMWLFQQCRNKWIKDFQNDIQWDEIMRWAQKAKTTGSIIDVDAPVFILDRSDMPKAIIDFCKEKNQKIPDSIGQIARVIYESIAIKIWHNLMILEKVIHQKLDYIHIIGGGTKDRLLCQCIADATGLPVFAGPTETTSAGNLLIQLKALGEIKDLNDGRNIIKDSSVITSYDPSRNDYWDFLYERFLNILEEEPI